MVDVTEGNGPMPETAEGQKAVDAAAVAASVVETAPSAALWPGTGAESMIFFIASVADAIEPWGKRLKLRDKQLREFFPQENWLLSALGVIAARNAAFSYELEGSEPMVAKAQDLLNNANLGAGWQDFITTITIDLSSQDIGAWVELIRADDSPNSPVIGINHLDAGRCWPTGNAEIPLYYENAFGKLKPMAAHQAFQLLEMPSPITRANVGPLFRVQYCAVTRLLQASQILKNITTYTDEKTGGRFARAIHLVRGVKREQVMGALDEFKGRADAQGLTRYAQPVVLTSVDPQAEIGHTTIELASLGDGFNWGETIKNYITILAMAFRTDYQEFAPLPGGNLGTSAQSQVLHLKSRGKGPGSFRKMITHLLNSTGVLPAGVQFEYVESDIQEETEQVKLSLLRAKERDLRIKSGEITEEVARQLAVDAGDLAPEIFEAMGGLDLTKKVVLADEEKPGGEKAEFVDVERRTVEQEFEVDVRAALNAARRRVAGRLRRGRKEEEGTDGAD